MIPNTLTVLRLISVPFILWLAAGHTPDRQACALGLFLLASLTDWLDGYIARVHNSITLFGTIMDPVTDKILVLGLLFVFHEKHLVPLWIVLVNLFRELFVSGIRQAKSSDGRIVGATWMGKLKFCIQTLAIAWVLLYLAVKPTDTITPQDKQVVYFSVLAMTAISIVLALNFFRWHSRGMLTRQTKTAAEGTSVEH